MLDLSGPERRYLLAACTASPQYAFRPRVVGRHASFADGDTDGIVSSLSRAGMVETTADRDVQLTEQGRRAARGFAVELGPVIRQRNTVLLVVVILMAVVVASLALLW